VSQKIAALLSGIPKKVEQSSAKLLQRTSTDRVQPQSFARRDDAATIKREVFDPGGVGQKHIALSRPE